MTRSHRRSSSASRTDSEWGDPTKARGLPSSRATRTAILFSKPTPWALETGRLSGSAQTRIGFCPARRIEPVNSKSMRASHSRANKSAARRIARLLALVATLIAAWRRCSRPGGEGGARLRRLLSRQREDHQRAAAGRISRQILHRARKAEGAVPHPRIDFRVRDNAGPAADAGQNRDVLPTVVALIRDRLTDDPGRRSDLPQHLARLGVHRLEPAIHRSVERDITRSHDGAAPHREILVDLD